MLDLPWMHDLVQSISPARLPVMLSREEIRCRAREAVRRAAPDGHAAL